MSPCSERDNFMTKFSFLFAAIVLLSTSFMSCFAVTTTTLITDQSALLAFKTQITFDPYNIVNKNWSTTTSVCNWIGISCGIRHQRVTALSLQNMGLSGTISPHLGNLSFLSSLNIQNNSFHGHVPEQLAHLHRCKEINLSYNNLSGEIPSWFGILPELQYLLLEFNSFSGAIPSSLTNISNLLVIRLRHNQLHGHIPKEIGNLSNLKLLNMEDNQFSGSIPFIFNMTSLESIGLTMNNLSGPIPAEMCNQLPQLTGLYLSYNQFLGNLPYNWYQCRKLQDLSLSSNRFTGQIPRGLGNMTMLNSLLLGSNKFTGQIPHELGNLKLEVLGIEEVGLTGLIPSFIFNISSLKGLSLFGNSLFGSLPWDMCLRLPELEELHLSNNKLTGRIPTSIGNCTWLVNAGLANLNLTGEIPQEIGNLYNLEALSLEMNNLRGHIPATIFNITALQIIVFNSNQFWGSLPSSMGLGLPNLEQIYIGNNDLNGVIPDSISNASRITVIDLSSNKFSSIIPRSLGSLELLEILNLGNNNFTGDASSMELSFISSLTNCRQLKELGIYANPLNGFLPVSIGNFSTSLYYIIADNSQIMGKIPIEIGNLSNLAFLRLGGNDLDGCIPTTIEELQDLQMLRLEYNKIQGSIPSNLCKLKKLGLLYLSKNELSDSIPACLGNITSLRELHLDTNKLTSSIPRSLWKLRYVLDVNLSSNYLIGDLPPEIGNLVAVTTIDLSRNQLSGILPSTIGGLIDLSNLSLSHNRFQGPIPESLGKLVSLQFLDLSHNNISGVIPKSLEGLLYLKYLNVSYNKLSGEIPNGGPFASFTYESFMSNGDLCGASRLLVSPCKTSSVRRSRKQRVLLALYIMLPIVSTIIALSLAFILIRCRRRKSVPIENDLLPAVTHGRISYHELRRATQDFSESNLLGVGSFGSVYKAILRDGTCLAVKVFNLELEGAFKSFDTECEVLRNIRHRNLIKVISSCSNLDFKALVLEYMPNGNLEKWLYSHNYFLDILQRLDIMIDVARALDYLHHDYSIPVVHCDLKPSNVLIDEHMVAHLSDFGISKLLGDDGIAQTKTLATFGYIAPEYGLDGLVSTRCDVYSYGIMLIEIFTRVKPSDEKFERDLSLKHWVNDSLPSAIVQVIDANLLNPEDKQLTMKLQCLSSVLELALKCSAESPEERMSMREVLTLLQKIRTSISSNSGFET